MRIIVERSRSHNTDVLSIKFAVRKEQENQLLSVMKVATGVQASGWGVSQG